VGIRAAALSHWNRRVECDHNALKVHKESYLVRSERHDGPRTRRELFVKDPAVMPADTSSFSFARGYKVKTVNAQTLDAV
jgi:hypothetical protein